MKTKVRCAVVLMVLLVMAGCAGTQEKPWLESQYSALASSQALYDAAWGGFVDLYREGKVDEPTYKKGLSYATSYYNAWMAWMDAVYIYGDKNIPEVQKRFDLFRHASVALMQIIEPYINKEVR